MSDLIFYTNGKETSRMPAPTLGSLTAGTKCPETKLEIKMTEIEKVKGEIKVLEKKLALLEEMENYKSPVEEAYKEWMGEYPPTTPSVSNTDDIRWRAFQMGWMKAQVPVEESQSTPMDEVVDRLVKKYQAQKLWNMVRDELGYSIDCCDEIVDLVEKWLPKEQSAAGSQNVDTELLVDGFNHCLEKIKGMLR
jgi:hypothetical protein